MDGICTRTAGALALVAALIAHAPRAHAQEETLTISLTTSRTSTTGPGGMFDFNPMNFVVVWLEDSSGNFVRTLGSWRGNLWYNLRDWAVASGYDVDAVTGATRSTYGVLNLTGVVITNVPDGTYDIVMELTEWEVPRAGQNNLARFSFTKDGTGVSLTPAAAGGFSGVAIDYSGRSTGNYAPGALAGPEMWVMLPATPAMAGLVSDDGGAPTAAWSQVGGPGTAVFADTGDPTTTVTFPAAGLYVLRLTADDGVRSSSDEVSVYVNATVLHPAADASVNSALPSENRGDWRWIPVNDTNEGYLRFDLSTITAPVTEAILMLAKSAGGDTSILREIRRVDDDSWGEMAITWSTRPSPDSAVLATIGTGRGWQSADLTPAVQSEILGDGVLSLNLRVASTGGMGISYNATETGLEPHWTPPRLVVFTESVTTPRLTLTLAPDSAAEDAGTVAGAGTVTASEPPSSDTTVTLTSADTSAVTVPATIVITASTTSASFDLTVVDDSVAESDQTVTVTAEAAGHAPGSAGFTVLDDDGGLPDGTPDTSVDAVADPPADTAGDGPGNGPSDATGCGCALVG